MKDEHISAGSPSGHVAAAERDQSFAGVCGYEAMGPPWSAMIGVLAALAVASLCARPGARAEVLEQPRLQSAGVETGTPSWTESWTETGHTLTAWVLASYERAPALMLGLAALLAVPPLALVGLLLRSRVRPAYDVTRIRTRRRTVSGPGASRERSLTARGPAWPCEAWIEVEAPGGGLRHDIARDVVRIGREGDNDISISDKTVHRYHAAIHRTDDADYVITDLSSAGGNGVTINGRRVSEARLCDGDTIELGLARLKFIARPA